MRVTLQELKRQACETIDARAQEIVDIGETIFRQAELGFKETRTAALVASKLRELGLEPRTGIALTGVKAAMALGEDGPSLGIMGELDAVVCHDHPDAVPGTGAVHACGHHAQLAAMLGAAVGLAGSGVVRRLAGRLVFIAVPAEEFVELEYRQRLRQEGKIEFLSGKQEFIRLGEFADLDLCMMVHVDSDCPEPKVTLPESSNGFVAKAIRYHGREAHAGAAPHLGINALNAAMLGIMGIHAQRETFRDEDMIRVHPIITRGGDLVNIVPADVRMETYVRGRSWEAMLEASNKVNRALQAGAMAIGAEVEVTEIPGYLPLENDSRLTQTFAANAALLLGEDRVVTAGAMGGSTDMGDLSRLMPVTHPMIGGCEGPIHTRTFRVVDPNAAYVVPAKLLAMTAVDLLAEGAALAREIVRDFRAPLNRESYLAMWRDFLAGPHG